MEVTDCTCPGARVSAARKLWRILASGSLAMAISLLRMFCSMLSALGREMLSIGDGWEIAEFISVDWKGSVDELSVNDGCESVESPSAVWNGSAWHGKLVTTYREKNDHLTNIITGLIDLKRYTK